RPAPGPVTSTSRVRMPASRAAVLAFCAAIWAANGVPLREPLKPTLPADDQPTTLPSGSVRVTMVLLKVAWIWATPCGTTRFSLRFGAFFPFPAAASGFAMYFPGLPYFFVAFFLPATAEPRGPLRVRELVCVRWPRTGRPAGCPRPAGA